MLHYYDGDEYDGTPIDTVREGTTEVTQVAEMGAEGTGTITIDDTAGTQAIVGHKFWTITEPDCANTLTYSGFVDDTDWDRAGSIGRAPRVGGSRAITVQVIDLNNHLSHNGLTSDAKRPAETCQERFDWLTGTGFWPAAVAIGSRVDIPAKGMDKADYTDQFPGDVLADIATAAGGLNFYVADWGDGPELTMRNDNTSTADSSAVRISNVLADVDSDPETLGANKTFAPSADFKLNRSSREVYSRMSMSFAKGRRSAERPATAAAFNGTRFGTATNSNVKTAAKALDALDDLLWIHSTPRDFLEGSILVPSSAVNLLRQGERLQVKFSHLANTGGRDYDEWTWCRVMERTVSQAIEGIYELRLRLSPQEEAKPAATIVQRVFARGAAGSTGLTLPNPVTVDGGGGDHVLVALMVTRDNGLPDAPTDDGGAWTRLNSTNETSAEHGAGAASGIAAYWKVTDSTDNTFGHNQHLPWCSAVWELDGVDMTSATLVTKDDQTSSADPVVMAIGAVSPSSGGLVLAGHVLVNNADGTGFGDYRPILASTVSSGLTQRFWNGPVDFSYGVHPATYYPLVSFADGGDDVTATTLTRPSGLADPNGIDIAHDDSAPTAWAGIAIVIPPA